jgi:hypothetical protein
MTKTNMSAQESLAALVAVSKKFNGFTGAAGARNEGHLRARLAAFVAGSPRFFGGQIHEMRETGEVDDDLVANCERVLAAYRRGIADLAADSPIVAFELAAKKYATMAAVIAVAPAEHAARRAHAAAVVAAKAARIERAVETVRSWTFGSTAA